MDILVDKIIMVMKELSIEEKAKRYESALERCRKLYNEAKANEYTSDMEDYETIFPELKESEDERIRKELIRFVKGYFPNETSEQRKSYLTWLEKQDEQKPIDINPSEFNLRLSELLKQFETLPKEELVESLSFYLNVVENDGKYVERQGEQKPVIIPKFRVGDTVKAKKSGTFKFTIADITDKEYVSITGGKYDIEGQDYLELVEQKPVEWTELTWKDIVELEGIINNVHYDFSAGIGQESFGKEVLERFRSTKGIEYLDEAEQKYWLEKQGDKKPVEWSEEDTEMIDSIIDAIDTNIAASDYHEIESWLKALRPQKQWKPTEEQMRQLHKYCIDNRPLSELYEQLKAL